MTEISLLTGSDTTVLQKETSSKQWTALSHVSTALYMAVNLVERE